MCTLTFLKDVLAGKKNLLKISNIVGIPDLPKIREINAAVIWADIKRDRTIRGYFPDAYITSERTPNREYMFNVDSIGFRSINARDL